MKDKEISQQMNYSMLAEVVVVVGVLVDMEAEELLSCGQLQQVYGEDKKPLS